MLRMAARKERAASSNLEMMTVTLKPKSEIVVPRSIRRKAGIKPGDKFEFAVCGRVIQIIPKLTADEIQDEEEIRDPKIRAIIRKGHQEFLAGKTRPIEELFAERALKAARRQLASPVRSSRPSRRRSRRRSTA